VRRFKRRQHRGRELCLCDRPALCQLTTLSGRIASTRNLTHDVIAIDVALDAPCDFDAGQFMVVSAPACPACAATRWSISTARPNVSNSWSRKTGGGFSSGCFLDKAGARDRTAGPLGKATFYPSLAKISYASPAAPVSPA
jgi:NAD(P)H-flavin reductase